MNKRPTNKDSEEDILKMQQNFFSEKSKNPSFQPAASFVKIEKDRKKSLFAQSRNASLPLTDNSKNEATKPQDKITESLKSKKANPSSNIILGDILEKNILAPKEFSSTQIDTPFPKVERITLRKRSGGKSLFALSMESKKKDRGVDNKAMSSEEIPMEVDSELAKENLKSMFGDTSCIVQETSTAESVHKENMEILAKMKENEIMAERQKILQSVDPSLLEFLAKKRKQKLIENQCDRKTLSSPRLTVQEGTYADQLGVDNPAVELLNQSSAEKWIHFDVIERDKLEWMRNIPETIKKPITGEAYEARFDWKGVLLPYTEEADTIKDDRELYLHGDEPYRPGYTLQELFRLARSNVMQQRVSAFTALGGLLSIYNQGYYDFVLELPIAKIFFLLRFGLDENTPLILEVVSKAMAIMFYNETDEALLDFSYENTGCYWQPILEVKSIGEPDDPMSVENLQKQLKNLRMASSLKTNVQESEEESRTSMTDFQLAEMDLIECFLRTNIIQRIKFIVNNVKPNNSTITSCLKILIRIARTNKDCALRIINSDDLITSLFQYFLPGLQSVDTASSETLFYNYPQYLVLKLCRILISQSLSFAIKLLSMNIVDRIQNYIFTQEDIKGNLIKVQIESLRVFRSLMLLRADNCTYRRFLPAFRYMLEWHYNHVVYEEGGPYLIRQHASALLNAISSGPNGFEVSSVLGTGLLDCCCNWFYKAKQYGVKEFSQSTLLTSCLNTVVWFTRNNDFEKCRDFIGKHLKTFLESESFLQFEQTLNSTSIVLQSPDVFDRRNTYTALPNVGGILMCNQGPQLIIPQTYCVYFLTSLWQLVEQYTEHDRSLVDCLLQVGTTEPLIKFLNTLSQGMNTYLTTNFFAKCELRLIYKLFSFAGFKEYLGKSVILQGVYNFLCGLSAEHIPEIENLFAGVVFNQEYMSTESPETLDKWRKLFLEAVYPHYVVVAPTEISLSLPSSSVPILPRDWPYFHLKVILDNYLQNIQQKPAVLFSEREIVRITLTFTSLLENTSFQITTPTEKLMYLMIMFMGPDSQFLEPEVKSLLKEHIIHFYKSCKDLKFDFDRVFEDKCKFENLYALFVDHFQAASYGDDLFSSLVLIPLAQKYDNKWRRMIWSEHASVLRFLDCDESLLLGGINAYLDPPEEEESLIKCYMRALHSNLVRPKTVPFKIAQYHLERFKESHAMN